MTQHYLVVGLGVTGLSVVKYLLKNNCNITVTDSRNNPPHLQELYDLHPDVEVLLGNITIPAYITTIVLSPGISLSDPVLEPAYFRNIEIIGDIELFGRVVQQPVYAVTGSNGKSTVTTLLGLMAKASGVKAGVGGNLGTAALDLIDPENQCYILELSSFQLETTYSLHTKAVTLLNISPDHMDRYDTIEQYKLAKQRIYNNAQFAVYNREDPLTAPHYAASKMQGIVTFGLDEPIGEQYGVVKHNGTRWLAKNRRLLMDINEMGMLGEHNIANALAALAIGEIAKFDLAAMLQTLRLFKGLEHRCEKVAYQNNVVWVNDSKGTNVAATVTAIEGLAQSIEGKWVIILGGLGKNADFTPLIEPVRKHCRAAILIGTERQQLFDLLKSVTPCFLAKNMAEVVDIAQQQAKHGDGVLLSPACASLDMFDNYAHRGEQFKQQVLQWIDKHNATTTTD